MQFDNRAIFLMPWHNLLINTLKANPDVYSADIDVLENWQACACSDSSGYTLVRQFRSQLIHNLLDMLKAPLQKQYISSSHLFYSAETAVWQILQKQAPAWLEDKFESYDDLVKASYQMAKQALFEQYSAGEEDFAAITWGKVNALRVQHAFSNSLGPLKDFINMPTAQGFGDSYMPAVQSNTFGASQRLIVQVSRLENAILTLPGGQSSHPLSEFFRAGFDEYINKEKTPLLPQESIYKLKLTPLN